MAKLFVLHDVMLNVDTTAFVSNSISEASHWFVKNKCVGMSLYILADLEHQDNILEFTSLERKLILDYDSVLAAHEAENED